MNELLANILETKQVVAEDGTSLPLHSEVSIDEGRFLQALIRANRPSASLEIGCAYGVSTLYICEALHEVGAKSHIVIDGFQDEGWKNIGLLNIARAGYGDLVKFYPELSYRRLPILEAEGKKIDFAFIDGQHTFDYVLVDFFYIDKMLNVGGLIVFDDVSWPSIRKLCRYILTNLSYIAVGPPASMTLRTKIGSWLPLARLKRPELRRPDAALGIGLKNFIAIRKLDNDRIGAFPGATRHWTTHHEF